MPRAQGQGSLEHGAATPLPSLLPQPLESGKTQVPSSGRRSSGLPFLYPSPQDQGDSSIPLLCLVPNHFLKWPEIAEEAYFTVTGAFDEKLRL